MSNTTFLEDLKDLTEQFENQKIDKKQVIATMKNIIDYETKLNDQENEFLVDWLYDDLHIELEKRREQDKQNPTVRKFLPIIIKKLELNKEE